jgi:thiamine-monophosphate kinase
MKLRELGEFGLIDRIAGRISPRPEVRIGIGDDAAALAPSPGCVTLVTSDMLVEGVHFDLTLCDPFTLGRKSLAVNLSDIAAMGGTPRHFLLALALPEQLPVEFLDRFVAGLLDMAAAFDVTLVGGDTCASRNGLVIAVTVMGEQLPERVVTRSGAQTGDLVFVTGTLGDAALGLKMLRSGERTGPAVARHLNPSPRVREGLVLAEAGIPTAMIDISDGLLADLGHILKLSGVGGSIELARLPLSETFRMHRFATGEDPFQFPLAGGEDYELLFTAPPDRRDDTLKLLEGLGTQATVIGEVNAGNLLQVIDPNGGHCRVTARGYDHFS